MEPNRVLEEFFFGRIKLVVDEKDIVVEPPVFYGQSKDLQSLFKQKLFSNHNIWYFTNYGWFIIPEPDLTFTSKLLGKVRNYEQN